LVTCRSMRHLRSAISAFSSRNRSAKESRDALALSVGGKAQAPARASCFRPMRREDRQGSPRRRPSACSAETDRHCTYHTTSSAEPACGHRLGSSE
jgi:hypothetical protein